MFSQSFGADVYGTKARVIRIEADVSDGLPVFDMVGFLASAVKEARERVRIAPDGDSFSRKTHYGESVACECKKGRHNI